MKKIILLITMLVASFTAQAQQYTAVTLWSFNAWTNNATAASNINAAVTLTKHDEFVLEVVAKATNAMGGDINIRWATSADGVNYTPHPALLLNSGWFGAPMTNAAVAGITASFITNINVASRGYWKILWATNQTGQHITNLTIKAYLKPRTDG